MSIDKIYAHLSCRDIRQSVDWFARLFDRSPDARPMDGLAEWHRHYAAGLLLYKDGSHAGRGTLTLVVSDLHAEHARLSNAGFNPSGIENGDTTSVSRLRDPDNDLVVLAQAGSA